GTEILIRASGLAGLVKIEVRDSGIGIISEDQKYVFERFFRSKQVQRKYPGMGIGLYVSSQIIKSHHGAIWVESEPGHGTCVCFTIPRLEKM
ncbi:MAG: ATP-binding protein, partial [Chitinophagaceae bacterium]